MACVGTAGIDVTSRLDRGRWIRATPYAPAVAGALLGLAALVESVIRRDGPLDEYTLLLCLLGLATTAPAALRQPTPAAVAITAAGVLSLSAFDLLTLGGLVAQILVAHRIGRYGHPPVAVLLGLPYLVLVLAAPPPSYPAVLLAALVPVAAAAGIARRVHREGAENEAAQHAFAGTLMEHTAHRERARIARELHDVVAHHISMIAVQAETARLTTPGMPTAGAQRLSAIGDTARAALTEMRRLLGVFREDTRDGVADRPAAADRRPQPGLRQLNELLDEARDATAAGTRLILRGTPIALDPGVELAAYRIVQEALTNSRRHAPGAAVDVELHYTEHALRLRIRDNGPGPLPEPRPVLVGPGLVDSGPGGGHGLGGHGLLGMRERAAAVGGELRTGPSGVGGFLVEATLPIDGEDTR
jgi:signal transduction histidine kinase